MKLTLNIQDERFIPQTYGTAKSEMYPAVDMALDGSRRFVADTLRGLADSIESKESR